jgi:mono/diheme cytochrome c family protein
MGRAARRAQPASAFAKFSRPRLYNILLGAALAAASTAALAAISETDARLLARGKYITRISGCNDCHTPGYAMTGGKVPEKDWLIGDALGWRGDWGTTYPINLRLYMQNMSETQWVKTAKSIQTRPPMPWFALRDMSEEDLRGFYRYVRSLRPAGAPAPAYVPPDQQPQGPFVQFPAAPK